MIKSRPSADTLRRIRAATGNLPLTSREKQVLALLLQGKSNKDIAASCEVQEQTVKDHLKHTYRKLGVHSRGTLFAWFLGRHLAALRYK